MKKVLIIRLSAIGDVAMSIPVIYSAARSNPEIQFTVVTQPFLCSLFINPPKNVTTKSVDIKGKEKKFSGILKYAFSITRKDVDTVVDLHNVIRSRIISAVLFLKGVKTYTFKKDRKGRKNLTSHLPGAKPLKPVIECYADTMRKAVPNFELNFKSLFENIDTQTSYPGKERNDAIIDRAKEKSSDYKYSIGIAPFARHEGKVYPPEMMEAVIRSLTRRDDTMVYLFGSKGREGNILSFFADKYRNLESVVGKYDLAGELALISTLDLMIAMDSANMHFASLAGTRVVSIWGATSPDTGFMAYNSNPDDIIQLDMPCRPCSVFGQKKCATNDRACMKNITPEMIITKIESILGPDPRLLKKSVK